MFCLSNIYAVIWSKKSNVEYFKEEINLGYNNFTILMILISNKN